MCGQRLPVGHAPKQTYIHKQDYIYICTYVHMYTQCMATVVNSCSYFSVVSCEPAAQRVAKEMNLHDDLVYYFALHIVTEEEDGSFTGKTL